MNKLLSRLRPCLPYSILLLQIAFFHRYILIGKTVFPWDIRTYHLPQALFVAKALRDGEFPLWNPFIYCGHPFAANIQAALFYPPRFVATLLGGVSASSMLYSLEIELMLHILLAGSFCFLLLRQLDVNTGASLIGATSFQLGAFFASQAEHLGAIEAAAWLPLIWMLILRLARRIRRLEALLLCGAMSMSLLSGFIPLTTVTLLSSGILVLLLIAARHAGPKLLALLLCCFAASLLLCAIVFFPAVQLTLLSVSRFRSDWIGTGGGLPLQSLYSVFWPNSFHVLDRGLYHGPYDVTLMYLYSGIVTLVGAITLLIRRNRRPAGLFALLLAISALFMLGASTPFGSLYSYLFPAAVRGVIYPQEWIAPFSLSLCILGAFGISAYTARTRWSVAVVVFAICDLTWFGSNRPFNAANPVAEPGVTETAFAGSPVLLETVRRFTRLTEPAARIDTLNDSIDWVGSAMITEVPTAGGEDPLALIRYVQARLAVAQGKRWGYYYQVDDIASPALQSFNVCCVVSRSRLPAELTSHSAYSGVEEIPGGFLYHTPSALPRFHLVHRTMQPADMAEAAALTKQKNWRPQEVAIVESFTAIPSEPGRTYDTDRVSIEQYRRNSVRLTTYSDHPSFLASSEAHFPGWRAKIDGQNAPIYFTNVAFRGLPVPAGKHVIEFEFSPGLLKISAFVSLSAWLVFLFLLLRCTGKPWS